MAFIKVPLGDAAEPEAVPADEYDLRIVSHREKESRNGNAMTQVTIAIEDANYPNASVFNFFIMHVQPGDDNFEFMNLNNARFLQLFGIPYDENGFDDEDLVGATARASLTLDTGDDGVKRNSIVLPRLKKAA